MNANELEGKSLEELEKLREESSHTISTLNKELREQKLKLHYISEVIKLKKGAVKVTCPICNGIRYLASSRGYVECELCRGLGWIAAFPYMEEI